jgi:hypothetical protein
MLEAHAHALARVCAAGVRDAGVRDGCVLRQRGGWGGAGVDQHLLDRIHPQVEAFHVGHASTSAGKARTGVLHFVPNIAGMTDW